MSEKEKDRLKIDTKKSFYDPIEIEIDGEIYRSKKMTRAFLAELNKLDKGTSKDNDEPLYKVVQFIFNVDIKTLETLDRREVEDIYLFTKQKLAEIDKERLRLITSTLKNTLGPEGDQRVRAVIPKNRKRSGSKR